MKNENKWEPTKYIYRKGKLIASRDKGEVSVSSRLVADISAAIYDEKIPQYVNGSLLDLGCGNAPFYQVYKKYSTQVTCADWFNSMHTNDFIDVECDLSKPLPFESNEFDTVILSDVLEHIFNPENLWEEIFRILAPQGRLILNVPFYYWIHEEPHDYYRYT